MHYIRSVLMHYIKSVRRRGMVCSMPEIEAHDEST
jgi:hypothetical protein